MDLSKVIEICKDFVPQSSYWCHWHCLWTGKGAGMDGSLLHTMSCLICVFPVRRIPVREWSTVPFLQDATERASRGDDCKGCERSQARCSYVTALGSYSLCQEPWRWQWVGILREVIGGTSRGTEQTEQSFLQLRMPLSQLKPTWSNNLPARILGQRENCDTEIPTLACQSFRWAFRSRLLFTNWAARAGDSLLSDCISDRRFDGAFSVFCRAK